MRPDITPGGVFPDDAITDHTGTVRSLSEIQGDDRFWGRPSVYDLWRDLRAASSEARPDWDLSTPGLREAWDAGDRSRFHGWARRAGQAGPPG
jgi:hypothetical protein